MATGERTQQQTTRVCALSGESKKNPTIGWFPFGKRPAEKCLIYISSSNILTGRVSISWKKERKKRHPDQQRARCKWSVRPSFRLETRWVPCGKSWAKPKKKRWRGNGRMHQKNREYSLHVSVCLSVCVCKKGEREGGTNWWNKTWLLLWRCPVEEDHLSCVQRPNHNSRAANNIRRSEKTFLSPVTFGLPVLVSSLPVTRIWHGDTHRVICQKKTEQKRKLWNCLPK